jgi:methylated-DNA-[protein]-cysteine S-methyltransferase
LQKYFYSEEDFSDIHIIAVSDGEALKKVLLNSALPSNFPAKKIMPTDDILFNTFSQLKEYFFEGRKIFSVPLNPDGTDFQKKVWNKLNHIPYGKTISYKQLAEKIGNKNLIRAVANANAKNPIPVLIPCHRVIGSDGSLTGYSAGLKLKRFLLELEGVLQKEFFL